MATEYRTPQEQAELDEMEGRTGSDTASASPTGGILSASFVPSKSSTATNAYRTKEEQAELDEMEQRTPSEASGVQLDKSPDTSVDPPGILDSIKSWIYPTTGINPELEKLPNLPDMPEMDAFDMPAFKGALGYFSSTNPDDMGKILKHQFPGVKVRQDGQYWIATSAVDGKDYSIDKPGLRAVDVIKALTTAGSIYFSGAGMGALAPEAVMTALEESPVLLGGPLTGAGSAAVLGGVRQGVGGSPLTGGEVLGGAALGSLIPAIGGGIGLAADKGLSMIGLGPQEIPGSTSTLEDLGSTLGNAARNDPEAKLVVAGQVKPNPETVAAADRQGWSAYLQPDHITTDQAVREMVQGLKSVPSSQMSAANRENLRVLGDDVQQTIERLGGTRDLSALDARTMGHFENRIKDLESQAKAGYADIRAKIPEDTQGPAEDLLKWIKERETAMGGERTLPAWMRKLKRDFSPRVVKAPPSGVLDSRGNPIPSGPDRIELPTYGLIDDTRKEMGRAGSVTGPFKDVRKGVKNHVYGLLEKAQMEIADKRGIGQALLTNQNLVAVRKSLEGDVAAIFGRQINDTISGSMLPRLRDAMTTASTGDVSKLVGLAKALEDLPLDRRREIFTSGLGTAFGKSTTDRPLNFFKFTEWMEGLEKHQVAKNLLMHNLDPEMKGFLQDTFQVARDISRSESQRITTGRSQVALAALKGADTLVTKIGELGAWGGPKAGAVLGAIAGGHSGLPYGEAIGAGAGASIGKMLASRFGGNEGPLNVAAERFLQSPEFRQMIFSAQQAPKPSMIQRMISMPNFQRLMNVAGVPQSGRRQWFENAMESIRQAGAATQTVAKHAGVQAITRSPGPVPIQEGK